MEEFDVNILFGEFLYDMGEYQKAEKYFANLLLEEDTPQRGYSLGVVYTLKSEYHRALSYLHSAYDQYETFLSSMVSSYNEEFESNEAQNMLFQAARIIVAIANIYFNADNSDEALINYTKALNIYSMHIPCNEIPHIGNCFQNIGLIYEKQGSYTDALYQFQQAIEIYSKTLPIYHPDKAGLLINIGNIYRLQENYDLSLKTYTDALYMLKKIYL